MVNGYAKGIPSGKDEQDFFTPHLTQALIDHYLVDP